MKRALSITLAILPFASGLFRYVKANDARMLWMALAAFVAAAILHKLRRPITTFIGATLFAAGAGYLLGAYAWFGVWAVAIVLALCFAASSALATVPRLPASSEPPAPHH